MINKYKSTISKEQIPYNLSKNWQWFLWSDIMKSHQNGMIRCNRELGKGSYYYLKMGNIDQNGGVDLSNLINVEASKKEADEYKLKEGDFIINVRNSQELVGKSCVISNLDNKIILFNHMLVRIDNGYSDMNYFINAYLNIPSSKKLLDSIKQGTTTVIAINIKDLKLLPIPLPDELTFHEITTIYKNIAAKIELNNKINKELESMAKTLYDYWFVQFDFPNKEGKPYKSSGGKMVYNNELKREIPEGWEVKSISEWIKNSKNGDWGKDTIIGNYKLKVNCIRGADINGLKGNDVIKAPERYILNKNSDRKLVDNDIIVEISGGSPTQSTGRIAFITNNILNRFQNPLICSNFCKALALNDDKYLYNFFYQWERLYVNGVLFDWEGKTSGIKNLLFESFTSKHLEPYPKQSIVEKFYLFARSIHTVKQKNLNQNQQLAELRDWLLPMLMNGQVTVKDVEHK